MLVSQWKHVTFRAHLYVCQISQGKYVPTISKKIHDENQSSADFKINFRGLGIGNGAIDPPNSFEFGEYLYQVNN